MFMQYHLQMDLQMERFTTVYAKILNTHTTRTMRKAPDRKNGCIVVADAVFSLVDGRRWEKLVQYHSCQFLKNWVMMRFSGLASMR
jgi:hypothetical protein